MAGPHVGEIHVEASCEDGKTLRVRRFQDEYAARPKLLVAELDPPYDLIRREMLDEVRRENPPNGGIRTRFQQRDGILVLDGKTLLSAEKDHVQVVVHARHTDVGFVQEL